MSPEALFVLLVGGCAIALFVSEIWPVDQVAIAVPAVLLIGGVIDLPTALAGLSNPATIAVAGFLIIGLALESTGVVATISRMAARIEWGTPIQRVLLLCGLIATISPFMSNTAVVVVFLPVFLALARQTGLPPSHVLIPLSYSAILGGTITLIGTSTNLIVHNAARNRGFGDLSMFSIAPLGLIYVVVGLSYIMLIGRRLLPSRPDGTALGTAMATRRYTTELHVTERSPVIGTRPDQLGWRDKYGLSEVRALHRWHHWLPRDHSPLRDGDVISVTGDARGIFDCARGEKLAPPGRPGTEPRRADQLRIAELMVAPGSWLVGRSLTELRFSSRFGVVVLAVQRAPGPLRGRMTRERLAGGDLLLVQGTGPALAQLADLDALVAIGEQLPHHRGHGPGWLALAILGGTVVVAAIGIVSIAEAAMLGAIAMVFGRCVRLDEIYRELDWPVIALLAGLLPLGMALDSSGAADWLAHQLSAVMGQTHPAIAVGAFYLVTSLLTEVMSNQAAAVVLTPIAIRTATELDTNPYALIVAVMFGASAAFMTPMGYQTNALVYGPGGYRFRDYLKVGAPLNLILAVVAAVAIPWLWP